MVFQGVPVLICACDYVMSMRLSFAMLMYSALCMMSLGVLLLDAWVEQIFMRALGQIPVTSLLTLILGSLLMSTGLTLCCFCITTCEIIASKRVFNEVGPVADGGECCAALVADAC